MRFKTVLQTLITGAFCITFGYYTIWGPRGLLQFYDLKQEVTKQQSIVDKLQINVKKLEQKIASFEHGIFQKEKIAREDLQMGFTNEIVYIIPKN